MHLHGHNFWVLAEGVGKWDGTTIVNKGNPQRRDPQILQPGTKDGPAYIVIEFQKDNPGVWPFHCHVAWHVSSGLYINIMVSLNSGSILFSSLCLAPFSRRDAYADEDCMNIGTSGKDYGTGGSKCDGTDMPGLGKVHTIVDQIDSGL